MNVSPRGRADRKGFAQHAVQDAILRTTCFTGLVPVPEGWRRSISGTQPVKPVCSFVPVARPR